jgi:hypothetical protein
VPSLPHPPELPTFFNQQRRPAPRAAAPASFSSSSTNENQKRQICIEADLKEKAEEQKSEKLRKIESTVLCVVSLLAGDGDLHRW